MSQHTHFCRLSASADAAPPGPLPWPRSAAGWLWLAARGAAPLHPCGKRVYVCMREKTHPEACRRACAHPLLPSTAAVLVACWERKGELGQWEACQPPPHLQVYGAHTLQQSCACGQAVV